MVGGDLPCAYLTPDGYTKTIVEEPLAKTIGVVCVGRASLGSIV